ncbi:MAG: tetratricopeptide repeat protein, partial [Proteobacteria bacterium]
GSLYDRTGDVEKGLAKMEQLLFVNPKNFDALNYLGYTWTVLGKNMDRAEDYLKQALDQRPDNAFVLDSYGWHLYVKGEVKRAIPFLEKAAGIKQDEAIIFEHLGDAYAKANLQERALTAYVRAARLTTDTKASQVVAEKIENMRTTLAQGGRLASPTSQNGSQSRRPASTSGAKLEE